MKNLLVVSFILALCTAVTALAQGPGALDGWQVSGSITPLGGGWVRSSRATYFTMRAELSFGPPDHWITIATDFVSAMRPHGFEIFQAGPPRPADHFADLGLLYGRRIVETSRVFVFAAAGIARMSGVYTTGETRMVHGLWGESEWVTKSWSDWCVPLEMRLGIGASSKVRMSIGLFQNVGTRRAFGGMTLGVHIGPQR